MDIRVSGRQIEVGEAFQAHVRTALEGLADRYFTRAIRAAVTLGKDPRGFGFHADCVMHVRQGVLLKAEASGDDAKAAFDAAAQRIDKQLRRYKRRLKNHHTDTNKEMVTAEASYTVFQGEITTEAAEAEDHPLVIAETAMDIPEVSVSDAVMLMDLRHAPALLFKDVRTGSHAMVYKRDDGNIGWVDPGRPTR